jgi:ankyrin repeat protein
MIPKRIILSVTCCVFVIVCGLCILSFAETKPGTNSEAEQHYEKANELYKIADYNNAITEFKTVMELSPNSAIAQNAKYWIGQLYFEIKQFDAALTTFQELMNEFPDSMVASTTKTMIERVQQAKKDRALFEAVKKEDTEQAKSLIAEGADIDAKWSDVYNENEGDPRLLNRFGLINSTPLWHAVDSNNIEMVKLLVEEDPNMNAGRWPPLCLAVDRKNTEDIIEYLIDHGANVNYPQDWGPLQEAATFSIEKVKLLVARGANVNGGIYQPTIHAGIRSGNREIVEFLIQHGADLNAKDQWGQGYTPLQRAALTGYTEIIKLLLEAGADINAKDDRGQTALHIILHAPLEERKPDYPRYRLSKDTIDLLLAMGADVNLKDNDGRSPLHLAAESADAEIVKLLLDKGADINAKDDESGFTALHYAARLAKKDVAELLIDRGADINAKDKEGHTSLYFAVNIDYQLSDFLINKGADSSIKTESEKTLLLLAQERKKIELSVPAMVFDGEPNSLFGSRIVCGDVDSDGYDDILIDARKYDNYRGRVCLYYGGPDMDNKPDLILEGQNERDTFGDGIACGDIDNDGYDDIVISAGGYNEKRGCAYLYWGSDRKSMDVKPDEIFVQETEKGAFFSLGYPAIYDIDNDGYRDIVLGACAYWSPGNGRGRVFLYYGNKKDLMDTTADLIFTEENMRDQFGHRIACGDVDNDGYGDIVIGTIDYPSRKQQDRTYIYYGDSKSNMDAKADVIFEERTEATNYVGGIVCIDQNNDGYDDLVIGDPGCNKKQGRVYLFYGNSKKSLDTEPDVTFQGEVEQSDYGIQVVCGDIDGDNVNDIVIGTRASVGRVYVYWGNELPNPNPKPGRIFTGENPNDGFGFGLACGDINNDGFDDLVIGALAAGANRGRVYLYYGGPRNK